MSLTNDVEYSPIESGDTVGCGFCGCTYSPAIEFIYDESRAVIYMRCPKCGKNDWRKERILINDKLPLIHISS